MTATLIIFVRHGKTPTTGTKLPGRAPNLHLSDEGKSQAEMIAKEIEKSSSSFLGKGVSAIYASPMERTQETARPIAKALNLRVRTLKGLNECDFGDWTGRRLRDLSKLKSWSTVQKKPSSFRFPNGESFTEMQNRMLRTVDKIRERHPGETIVCVSHADPIKAILASAVGTPLDLFQRIMVGPCSASVVLYTKERPLVLTLNSNGNFNGSLS
ncbi:MAG: histidine phosphatase family protein [Acidimicrobiales bacterium]|jgi:probable phosphoglycerate mutase|nr:phosphoglycerate mutase [Acidimicrobiaceae bacterium]MDP6322339.1 histidine phosphatase family protein [Acidimicrobiales bacterium]MDP6894715.1 histidine phosphatase family protein [Acidimicrobiales bacterium]HJM37510.1 histidine phosphatase family protein [Acidimicrobiales bacterium]|tara:strand:+ start:297 stop:935 length:639 start_codon:yes stop_codon:yes gene_type:complete